MLMLQTRDLTKDQTHHRGRFAPQKIDGPSSAFSRLLSRVGVQSRMGPSGLAGTRNSIANPVV